MEHNIPKEKVPLKFIIEGKEYETCEQYMTGAELKQLAGIPLETELFLSVSKPYNDELIGNDTRVNLARPETEYFFVKKKLFFTINGVQYTWYKQFIRGIQIRELAKISPNDDLFLDLPDGWKDDFIEDDEIVDLARPGVEHFVSRPKIQGVEIIVNQSIKKYDKPKIAFEEVVRLANGSYDPNRGYTVKYSDGPKENPNGLMSKGTEVFVKHNMNFNVRSNHQS
ncbi:hypothetical protein FACS189421_09000 [Bacteroidia bacterium]|nr:hypothetical protein FACS189421_09000 [Bacteroidia bacterium]GHT03129.1 hypothetical protein FACS189423_03320 [Bacteroidia bacterium]GHT52147.1 hypothetical protein FACS189440_21770 [Bacteroidia bacterium]